MKPIYIQHYLYGQESETRYPRVKLNTTVLLKEYSNKMNPNKVLL